MQISGFSCTQLFGRYNHEITFADLQKKSVFLYGDNGSGKTTIIRLIYNLLSSEKGTKTAIANIPFKAFSLYLKNGGTLSVHRQDNLIGDYSITYEKNGSTQSYSVHASAENRVLSGKNPEMSSIKKLIDSFQLKLFYVTHDRVLKTNDTRIKVHESSEPDDLSSDDHWGSYTLFQDHHAQNRTQQKLPLKVITSALRDHLRLEALQQENMAQNDVNSIYLDIAKRLSAAKVLRNNTKGPKAKKLLERINSIEKDYSIYRESLLLPNVPFHDFHSVISDAPENRKNAISEALTPFVDSLQARMKTLQPVADLVESLQTEASQYFWDKKISFNIMDGLHVQDMDEDEIKLDWLSSGEQQLLFMLCAVALMRDNDSLVLIDEPEISLNIKWQRKIMDSLINISGSFKVQFIVATHAFEILSQHQEQISNLNSKGSN